MPGKAVIQYTIPISQSTPKTAVLLGGRPEELWVGSTAEAPSQLAWKTGPFYRGGGGGICIKIASCYRIPKSATKSPKLAHLAPSWRRFPATLRDRLCSKTPHLFLVEYRFNPYASHPWDQKGKSSDKTTGRS